MLARLCPRWVLRYAHDSELVGRAGEVLAGRFLRRQGYRVLFRRLVTEEAEIDLVCRKGERLVCVEVKTGRIGASFRPGMRISRRAIDRLWNAARALETRYRRPTSVDLVEVDRSGPPTFVHHREVREPL